MGSFVFLYISHDWVMIIEQWKCLRIDFLKEISKDGLLLIGRISLGVPVS